MSASMIQRVAELICRADRIAVLTGAGMSTESGIPDFRSPTGVYSDERNTNVFDLRYFRANPEGFYRFAQEFYPLVEKARPNAAHQALARWEAAGKDVRIATQNIDDLHQRAGSKHVYPVHGTMRTATCQGCGKTCESGKLMPMILAGQVPLCTCGGVFKPDITFFGELLPERAWQDSVEAMSKADLVMILGTSLAVYPAASLPSHRSASCKLIIINREVTPLDGEADAVSRDSLGKFITSVNDRI